MEKIDNLQIWKKVLSQAEIQEYSIVNHWVLKKI